MRTQALSRMLAALAMMIIPPAAFLTACAPRDAEGVAEVEIDTLAGVETVRNRGLPPVWTAERVLSIGRGGADDDARGPDVFGAVTSVLADDAGNVYVGEALAKEVRVFGPDGRHLRTIGREGAGPGEFREVQSLAWMGGRLAVLDPGNARISLLSRDGRQAVTWRHQRLTGGAMDVRLHRASDTLFFTRVVRAGGDGSGLAFARYGARGIADTVASLDRGGGGPGGVLCESPQAIRFFDVPFAARREVDFSPGGDMVVSTGGGERLAFVQKNGDTVRVIEAENAPASITDAEWERETAGWREFRAKNPGADCQGELARPAAKASIRHFLFSPAGELWVEAEGKEGVRWDVFDASGRRIGTLPAPERARWIPPYVRGDRLYLVRTDALDVPFVDVYRITRKGGR